MYNMASNNSGCHQTGGSQSQIGTPKSLQQQIQGQPSKFDSLEKSSNTLKRNPKMELNKTDLLRLLGYLEGELQAREVVIATLKCERVKQLLHLGNFQTFGVNDVSSALQRDSFASTEPGFDETQIRTIANAQLSTIENLSITHKRVQLKLARIFRDIEERHRKVIQEYEEEKRKHEHDTAQGDDITYGLEKDRTRLKQELELEKQNRKKLEKEVKKITDILEEERARQKQIVLLLLSERKKLVMKYVEERKRSEDLAQILTEEKSHVESMAEGLEEESKKSLQMEAELEKQLAQFDTERQQLKSSLSIEEKRSRELEQELEKVRADADSLRKQLAEAHQVAMFQAATSNVSPPRLVLPRPPIIGNVSPPQPSVKPSNIPSRPSSSQTQAQSSIPLSSPKAGTWNSTDGSISPPPISSAGTPMMSSVAKVVQPTATVSSVPVSGPTTGIARSVSPGQGLRNASYSPTVNSDTRMQPSWSSNIQTATIATDQHLLQQSGIDKRLAGAQVIQVTPRVSLSASPGTKVITTAQGGKVTFHVTTNAGGNMQQQLNETVPLSGSSQCTKSRGIPPPVPPNKPVVPPKKEVRRQEGGSEIQKTSFGSQGLKFGITISKDKVHSSPQISGEQLQVCDSEETENLVSLETKFSTEREKVFVVDLHETQSCSLSLNSIKDLNMLDQELEDFEQVISSMASNA